jgi:Caspase domain/WD domain, G-beta repeat
MIRASRIFVLAFLVLLNVEPVRSEQASALPMLRLETGMHTAPIRAAAMDASGRLLATASLDKTVRLWSLPSGELLRVLRPAIGSGAEGELFAVAVSPDGHFVVAAGWTGYEWEKANSVYVFESGTGQLVRRIGGLPQVINRLAWSPDGRYVAVGLAGANGIRVFETGDWHEVFADSDYKGPVYGLSFTGSSQLAVAAFDGVIRLYGADQRPVARVRTPGGGHPYSLAFSPDDSVIAVGYGDTLNVDILSVPDLRRIGAADTSGLAGGSLSQIAWTRDGALLAGGAHWSETSGSPIFRWAEGGRGKRAVLAAADATVTGLLALPDGGFVYATADPALGEYAPGLNRVLDRRSATPDFRGQLDRLRLSADGAQVAFGLHKGGGSPAWFDVAARSLSLEIAPRELSPAESASLALRDWQNGTTPRLMNAPLALEKNETSRSVAIASDRRSFVLGTDWYLRRFGNRGEPIWAVPLPSPAWAVNVSGDGRVAVAALADGTIRWYRYHDGRPLLALFMDRDGKRWVMWTPEGHYDASPGGEDLIGWHINRGLDETADFFGVSRFRDRYYRPKVVEAVLRGEDVDTVLREARAPAKPPAPQLLPPVIRIVSPGESAAVSKSPVEIRYAVRSPSGEPVTAIDVKVDGRPVDQPALPPGNAPAGPDGEREGSVSVPLGANATITLVARAGERTSEPASVKIAWKGSTKKDLLKPKLYVLTIGVSQYRDPNLVLRYAANDAGDVAAALKQQEGRLYGAVEIKVLRDDDATLSHITEGLDWIAEQATSRDVALVFMAGHGMDEEGKYYFLPVDVDMNKLRRTAEPQTDIDDSLRRIAGKALFFFDTCHSGAVMGGRRGVAPDINGLVNDLASAENGVVVFAASTGRESAFEREEWGHGAFSKALLEALTGKAEVFHEGVITVASLEYWLAERVKKLTDGHQHATSAKPRTISDFPIAAAW